VKEGVVRQDTCILILCRIVGLAEEGSISRWQKLTS